MKIISTFLLIYITSIVYSQTPQITFEVNFNDGLLSIEDEPPSQSSGIEMVPGIVGSGVEISLNDILQYKVMENLNSQQGSLSLWVKPGWDPGGVLYRTFVLGHDPRNFELHLDENSTLAFAVNTSQVEGNPLKVAFADGSNWKNNNWYFLTYTWDSKFIRIYVNGNLSGFSDVGFNIPVTTDSTFHIGSYYGEDPFQGTIDEVRIYDGPLSQEDISMLYADYLQSFPQGNALKIIDLFDRDITEKGLTLVDWEGPVANPAMKYFIKGSEDLNYPLTIEMSSDEERAYFNYPSSTSKNGPNKTIEINSFESMPSFLMAYYMDEDFDDDQFDLDLRYISNGIPYRQTITVNVIDQDYERELSYPISVDFSEVVDPFMQDKEVQNVIIEAAEDWLYYVDGDGMDTIPAGESWLNIGGQDHNFLEKRATNSVPYKGFYLFSYENTNSVGPCFCSTGFPNRELLNTKEGEVVPLPRIGGLHLNQYGQAFNTEPTGWEVLRPYDNWTGDGNVGVDMYSLAKHEIGHALVFEEIPLYKEAQQRLGFVSPALTEYYGDTIVPLLPEALAHLFGLIDPASQTTPYGGGVDDPVMLGGREMLTKLDILIMESVGYPLRENKVTMPLGLRYDGPLEGVANQSFTVQVIGEGGISVYYTTLEEGPLPPGLSFDVNTGIISGLPTESGTYPIKFRVKDYTIDHPGIVIDATIRIIIEGSSLADLISFSITEQIGETEINPTEGTIKLKMPASTDLTLLAPQVSISEGATIDPPSGEPQDFTVPVIYTVTSENGEVSNYWTAIVESQTTSIADHPALEKLSIYPTPFSDQVTLSFELSESKDIEISFFLIDGRTIMKQQLGSIRKWKETYSTDEFYSGIHFMQIRGDGELIATKKLLKM